MNIDFLFEVSWEVCNKVGGIHTVVSTKAKTLVERFSENYILIGPDILRESKDNPEFEEDVFILKTWREYAQSKGLRFRIGRWKIAGEPIVILVDFTQYISDKDSLFKEYWERFSLDSITGEWDYIEPFLFGYASAKVIESYYEYYLSSHEGIISHWHEWMTGSGLLYIKQNCPQIATVFTTHATSIGRSIAGNNLPLYSELRSFDANNIADEFNLRAKFSLENLAVQSADVFTTVSEITDLECQQFFKKGVDIITPNGFELDFVPKNEEFELKRAGARRRIIALARALTNQPIDDEAFLIINSGRYEYKNKGIDLFIKAMGELNNKKLNKQIIAVIAVPAHTTDIYKSLAKRIGNEDLEAPTTNHFLTHHLYNPEQDPILREIRSSGLSNSTEDNVKIIFIPAYLNGEDGIVNIKYFDFLIGFDMSVFPSYYEPWGYTPMESMSFSIPSITTNLAGFGLWIKDKLEGNNAGSKVIERNDFRTQETIDEIIRIIESTIGLEEAEIKELREQAFEIAQSTLWSNLIKYYYQAFEIGIAKTERRIEQYSHKSPLSHKLSSVKNKKEEPIWRKFFVKPNYPKRLEGLIRLSQNLWWSWNWDAKEVFEMIDSKRFYQYSQNPIRLLESLSNTEINSLMQSVEFLEKLDKVVEKFDNYMSVEKDKDSIAYFSMEFGVHDSLKIFSGGLGILAGDYLKQASDSNKNIIGIGLLYRYGYFKQGLTKDGEQVSQMYPQKFTHLPAQAVRDSNGEWKRVSIEFPGRTVQAKIWQINVGRIPLYLLDTDIEENQSEDREITYQLYGGNWENRLKQEILLGIGGVRMLRVLGINPNIYHANEGHSAFNSIERVNMMMNERKYSYAQSREIVRASTLFTTHTPVPAGHDVFSEDLIRMYLSSYTERLAISWEDFMALGRMNPEDNEEKFSMSILALNFSSEVNGVSKIHRDVSRKMFAPMYKGYFPRESHIGYVTNGVHRPTWTSKIWEDLYQDIFPKEFDLLDSTDYWKNINLVDDKRIWDLHQRSKELLGEYLAQRLEREYRSRAEDPKLIIKTKESFSPKALTIGFARRFATYKRAHLLFTDIDRLDSIVNHPEYPVQFIFAGKAHPADKAGRDLIKKIVEISKQERFIGKILFVENYDINLAKHLISGVDVWLNTPTRPMEASGTSGEKALMNGVVNFSVLDGWWAEGYIEGGGWALDEEQVYEREDYQNSLDAETIYKIIENLIAPYYYCQNQEGVSQEWVSIIKKSISQIAPRFTMKRQVDDYFDKFYNKQFQRAKLLSNDEGKLAREIAAWKNRISRLWSSIELVDINTNDLEKLSLNLEENFKLDLCVYIDGIAPEDIGAEIVLARKENDIIDDFYKIVPLEMVSYQNQKANFSIDENLNLVGVFDYSIRIYPKNDLLPYRMDFDLVKWL
ncbi:MAG: alpha-glucan family phosphorylase [Bacteroidales bacterium]|nr:alpha-glucan family phosphorylase [Bacteroidales bacterium]